VNEVINRLTAGFGNLQVKGNFLLDLSKRGNLEVHFYRVADTNIDPDVGLQVSVFSFIEFEPEGYLCFRGSLCRDEYTVLPLASTTERLMTVMGGALFMTY
jgi:hypothetical protein